MIPLGDYQRTDKLIWTAEGLADSKILRQELHFLEGNKHFILKADQINLTYLITDWEGGAKETLSAG